MYSITLKQIADEFQLEEISACGDLENIMISTSDVNRPGLQLAGYFGYFGHDRVQVIGKVETTYLELLEPVLRYNRLEDFFKAGFPCLVVAHGLPCPGEIVELSNKYAIPVLRTHDTTSRFMSGLIRQLAVQLAPRTTEHGVLVEVYGEGILMLGESGVGKSETALELVKRGHRLIADDAVEIRRVSEKTLLGTSPEIIRYLIEIRGIGIMDVKNLFGVGAVKDMEKIGLVVMLESWDEGKSYERLGLEDEFTEILEIKVPMLRIPVRPGRNLAVILEAAAMNHRQRKMGYNAAKALNERLIEGFDER